MSLRKRGARWSQPVLCSPVAKSTQKPVSEPVSQLQAGPSLLPPDLTARAAHRRHAKRIKGLFMLEGHTSPSGGRCPPGDSARPERRVRAASPAPALPSQPRKSTQHSQSSSGPVLVRTWDTPACNVSGGRNARCPVTPPLGHHMLTCKGDRPSAFASSTQPRGAVPRPVKLFLLFPENREGVVY